ncbi:MAG: hypothetical protein GX748_12920 [Lentisphaerae bacterium]|nr:hypothetical protein [Lentisphaerota bacterium]
MISKLENMDYERGASRAVTWLACAALALVLAICLLAASGCASILDGIGDIDIEKLDALAEKWKAKLEEKIGGTVETPTPDVPTPGTPSAPVDQLDYALLRWQYGGVNAGGAKLDSPRISSLSCNGRAVSYRWDVGMSGWGLSNGDAGAICCIFFERGGQWIGGKFDWVSVSRTNRELTHCEYYSNWGSSGIKLPWRGKVAFVVVSADGKRRSNVLVAEAK